MNRLSKKYAALVSYELELSIYYYGCTLINYTFYPVFNGSIVADIKYKNGTIHTFTLHRGEITKDDKTIVSHIIFEGIGGPSEQYVFIETIIIDIKNETQSL